jgi:hypothetical protein
MDCPVLERIAQNAMSDRFIPVQDGPFKSISFVPEWAHRFGILVHYCAMCPYKSETDWEGQINKKIEMAEKYGSDRDTEVRVMRVFKGKAFEDRPGQRTDT